ncbi:MAG TPA: AAA family ATPase [Bacilli bacterium]|nr:AAA family ATPase [Bacilli bacterium]
MKLNRIKLENFRGFNELNMNCGGKSVVLLGKNGAGKTTILDGIALMLSRIVKKITNIGNEVRIDDTDVMYKKIRSHISIEMDFHDRELHWGCTKKKRDTPKWTGADDLQHITDYLNTVIDDNYEHDGMKGMPICIYYPVHRIVNDIPLRIRKKHDFSIQDTAFERAMTGGADFRTFFEWYRNREDLENEKKIQTGLEYIDLQLNSVRTAIYDFLPNFKNLRISRSPLRMLIEKEGITLEVNQLSDGEKCLLALVGDLARRLAIANPGLDNPLLGEGIVMIDEVELHLHPKWQRKVISGLTRVFRNIQFIITTHSPQVIGEADHMKLFVLEYSQRGNKVHVAESVFGQDVNYVTEEIMEVPIRNEEVQSLIEELYRVIEDCDWPSVDRIRSLLKSKVNYNEVPELLRADMIINRRRDID